MNFRLGGIGQLRIALKPIDYCEILKSQIEISILLIEVVLGIDKNILMFQVIGKGQWRRRCQWRNDTGASVKEILGTTPVHSVIQLQNM